MKRLLSLAVCIVLALCGAAFAQEVVLPEYSTATYDVPFATTLDAIDALKQPCDEQGSIVTLDYTAPAYAVNELLGRDETVDKTVQVYLPYGYDGSEPCDILYLLHGTGGSDEYWFLTEGRDITRNVLDNMIQQGLCKPLIVVTPNFYAEVKGEDNVIPDELAAAYGEQHGDSFIEGRNDIWAEFFQYELVNDIIPLVESEFSTYAYGDTDEEGLIDSREHRALAGLSRGSMATMRAGLVGNLDKFAWFGNFSGIWLDVDKLEAALAAHPEYPINYWYNGTGTADFAAENHLNFHNEVMARLGGYVTDGENYCMIVKDGGAHDYPSWIADLYNSLLVFFK